MHLSARDRTVGVAGILIVLAGLWGGIVAYAGPAFGFGMGTTRAWVWTEGRATLHLAPAIAAVVGGLVLLTARGRATQLAGALLATVAGTWFVIAPTLAPLWEGSASRGGSMGGSMGHMMGGTTSRGMQALEGIGYHYGTGALITALAAFAVGALAVAPAAKTVPEREHGPERSRAWSRLRTHPEH